MNRLKIKEIAAYRQALAAEQGLACSICGGPLAGSTAHLDHDHKTGMIRGVLHRECNILLGKLENFFNSYGHPHEQAFLKGVFDYRLYHRLNPSKVYHHTYRTPEEKRLRRNARARKQRKGAKKQ